MRFNGTAASPGYARGVIYKKEEAEFIFETLHSTDPLAEKHRLNWAIQQAKHQVLEIQEKTAREVGADHALIFDAHLLFLEDPVFLGALTEEIDSAGVGVMKAVSEVSRRFIDMFTGLDDEYLRERASDLHDVSTRLLDVLSGVDRTLDITLDNTVVVAHDLTPSDTASMDKSKVAALVTDVGGKTSHTAIMSRSLGIPAVVGLGSLSSKVRDGDHILVDGVRGEVILDPTMEEIAVFEEDEAGYIAAQRELLALAQVEAVTKDGKRIEIAANIGKPSEVDAVLASGADGIGLYRTEFLYMNREELPTEEEQFSAYKVVLERMGDKPVLIRTLDVGGDKRLTYLSMPREINPFLGYRAIRLCLDRPDMFKDQLRALLRASIYGNLKVMFPMISGIGEYHAAMALVEECRQELTARGIPYRQDMQWGIMIEIPSAAILADELAEEADFFSIGSNDLIQYTLAADRMSEKVSYLYDPMHPAVLRLIKITIDGAHAKGKWCGMCGEMASDPAVIPLLVSMGLDEFSMSPVSILPAKRIILELDSREGTKDAPADLPCVSAMERA